MNNAVFLDEQVQLRWNRYTKKYYEDLGYTFTKFGDSFNVKPNDIMPGSRVLCKIQCPKCSKEFEREYRQIVKIGSICPSCNRKKEILLCDECHKQTTIRRKINNKYCCNRCYHKIKSGYARSIFEPNTYKQYKDYAEYDLRNNKGEIIATFTIDIQDIDMVNQYKWRLSSGRVKTQVDGVTKELSHVILNVPVDKEVDHLNRDPLNNRRRNLRIVSHEDNCNNRGGKRNYISVAGVIEESLVDGEGIRFSIFSNFCLHHCGSCHNPETWSLDKDKYVSVSDLFKRVNSTSDAINVTFSGGDPFFQAKGFANLAKMIKEKTHKTIWCYTGFVFEDLISSPAPEIIELLNNIDVLVDGPFILSERDTTLAFRGSRNQRIIDVKKSLKKGEVILYIE